MAELKDCGCLPKKDRSTLLSALAAMKAEVARDIKIVQEKPVQWSHGKDDPSLTKAAQVVIDSAQREIDEINRVVTLLMEIPVCK